MCQDRCHQGVNTLETGQHCEPAILHRAPASLTMLGNLHPGKAWAVSTCSWVGLDAGSPVCVAEEEIIVIVLEQWRGARDKPPAGTGTHFLRSELPPPPTASRGCCWHPAPNSFWVLLLFTTLPMG